MQVLYPFTSQLDTLLATLDFRRRFLRLLGYSFRTTDYRLAMRYHHMFPSDNCFFVQVLILLVIFQHHRS